MEAILGTALSDAVSYKDGGVDALLIENMHDVPYLRGHVEPETTAAMAVIAHAIKYETVMPIGIQILAGANLEALGVAIAAGLDFLRVEGYVYAHIGDEGWHQSCAAELIRRRAGLKADHIKIFADIKKKHSAHAITHDVSLVETARTAEFFKADGVIVTGEATGYAPDEKEVHSVRAAVSTHVLAGSGVTPANIRQLAESCDALIVGSSAKYDGIWSNEVDPVRVEKLIGALAATV